MQPSPTHRGLAAKRILRAIGTTINRWQNADFPPRARALRALRERTGYSEPVVTYALDRLFSACTESALRVAIESELEDISALDGFLQRAPRPALYARGVKQVAIISSQTTIGVALPAVVFALIAKSQVLVKDREDGLLGHFFATLVEEEPALAHALHAEQWDGADAERLKSMDVVVAFGRSETLTEIRNNLSSETRFIGFGPRISCGILRLTAIENLQQRQDILMKAARDVILYEAEGCMSLHLLFVKVSPEKGSDLDDLISDLSNALTTLAVQFPPAKLSVSESLRRSARRSTLRFRAVIQNDRCIEGPHSLILLTRTDPPPLQPGMLALVPIENDEDLHAYIQRHRLRVEAVSIQANDTAILTLALATGAVRITAFGQLQDPPILGEHGGRPRILDFVELMTCEVALG